MYYIHIIRLNSPVSDLLIRLGMNSESMDEMVAFVARTARQLILHYASRRFNQAILERPLAL